MSRGEYDVTESVFLSSTNGAEYDEIDRISMRYTGVAGPGYRIFDTDAFRFQIEGGGGYVYRRFFGGDTEDYPAAYFGFEGRRKLMLGSIAEFAVGYIPSLEEWETEYLIQARGSLSYPIHEYLSLKITIRDTYDSSPDNLAQKNEFKTLISISWRFGIGR